MKVPDRGDVIVLDFDPQAGHEQMKRRPALVLSPAAFNDAFGLAYVAPVTTKPNGHAFEVALTVESNVNGVVLVHQLKSLDWRARRARLAGKASAGTVAAAIEIVKDIIEGS
ncbi:MAG TPA: type II toxin-antitoxin system PemK/MazF family toxin [Candidatus Lustribacter sp.]